MKPYGPEFVTPHFHPEMVLPMTCLSCQDCDEEELCPLGYSYNEICHPIHDKIDIDKQSTIYDYEVVDHLSVDDETDVHSVKLSESQKKNLKRHARKKELKKRDGCDVSPPAMK